uniref:Uncharacterized protein n=1 Tax=Anopheles minimus TaxID=112268 RepID=A0A182VQT8_9DIPT
MPERRSVRPAGPVQTLPELDYGTIMCWADNVVGQQKEPCVFHLIAAGKPEMPYNCSLVNQTSESLEVDCAEVTS